MPLKRSSNQTESPHPEVAQLLRRTRIVVDRERRLGALDGDVGYDVGA